MKFKNKAKKKKEKKTGVFIVIFLAGIMILSVVGFLNTGGGSTDTSYNGYDIFQAENSWVLEIDDQQKYLNHHPQEVEYIADPGIKSAIDNAAAVYITFDPIISDLSYIDLSRFDIANELIGTKQVFNGIVSSDERYNLPEVTCDTAKDNELVIYFRNSSTQDLSLVNNCLIASGTAYQFVRLKDRIIYGYLGVI